MTPFSTKYTLGSPVKNEQDRFDFIYFSEKYTLIAHFEGIPYFITYKAYFQRIYFVKKS